MVIYGYAIPNLYIDNIYIWYSVSVYITIPAVFFLL